MANRDADGRLSLVTGALAAHVDPNDAGAMDGSTVLEAGASEYASFKAGQINFEEYLDLSVERAVAHVRGRVPEEQLGAMRQVLRHALLDDPHLSALAARVAQSA